MSRHASVSARARIWGFATAWLASNVAAQLPADPRGLVTFQAGSGRTVRVKEATGTCETTEGVRSYAGYVDLDPNTHMHFWLFESRNDRENAATTIYVPGGPMQESTAAALTDGPCVFKDENLELNPHSWTELNNLLLVDIPVGNGFSYSTQVEGDLDDFDGIFQSEGFGRFPTANLREHDTTPEAVAQLYGAVSAIFEARPEFAPDMKSRRINISGRSYAGHVGPEAMNLFLERNEAIAGGQEEGPVFELGVLAIGAGCLDQKYEQRFWPKFAIDNTYGIRMVDEGVVQAMEAAIPECESRIDDCRDLDVGTSEQKTTCREATEFCILEAFQQVAESGFRSINDIRLPLIDTSSPVPPVDNKELYTAFFNDPEVQNSLGVRLNFTLFNKYSEPFFASGDPSYSFGKQRIESLLAAGVAVHLWYGDADYNCNWFAGEQFALDLEHADADAFRAAGYAPLMLGGRERGAVRQHGNLSFTRIYDAGHFLPVDQPEVNFAVFERAMLGKAVADGAERESGRVVSTEGPPTSDYLNEFAPLPGGEEDAGGPPLPRTPGGLLTEVEKKTEGNGGEPESSSASRILMAGVVSESKTSWILIAYSLGVIAFLAS